MKYSECVFPSSWQSLVDNSELQNILGKLDDEVKMLKHYVPIYPHPKDIFNAFNYFEPHETKVCLIGQDCYVMPNQAHGLSFSVRTGVDVPPSLKNMMVELKEDIPEVKLDPTNGNLESWAREGVLLLNSGLSVRKGDPGSHLEFWEKWTDTLIRNLANTTKHIVFILLGSYARKKKELIDETTHKVIVAGHPSPNNNYGNFKGSRIYSKTNEYLISIGKEPVNWHLCKNIS